MLYPIIVSVVVFILIGLITWAFIRDEEKTATVATLVRNSVVNAENAVANTVTNALNSVNSGEKSVEQALKEVSNAASTGGHTVALTVQAAEKGTKGVVKSIKTYGNAPSTSVSTNEAYSYDVNNPDGIYGPAASNTYKNRPFRALDFTSPVSLRQQLSDNNDIGLNAITTATSAQNAANLAVIDATNAVTTAGLAQTTAGLAQTTATQAFNDVQGAIATSNQALTTATAADVSANLAVIDATNAVTTAGLAQTTAGNALTTAGVAQTTADSSFALGSSINTDLQGYKGIVNTRYGDIDCSSGTCVFTAPLDSGANTYTTTGNVFANDVILQNN